jgi:hypothetical protein
LIARQQKPTRERELTLGCEACLLANGSIGTEEAMRGSLGALMAIGALAAIGAAPAAAAGSPYCIKGCDFGGGAGDYSFSSYQQCLATASGRDASCAVNPYYSASAELGSGAVRQSRRKF